jgi:carbon-monoxide dehydrogenase medium subunit
VVGAAVTHRELERSAVVAERLPALARMERDVANIRVREVGTLGGNLCFSDPHSDPATFLLAVDAAVECRRGGGEPRRLPIADLVVGPYQTSLGQGELLTAVRIPALPEGAAVAHAKFSFHERPTATVACLARVVDGVLAEARVAVGSVGVRPVRSRAAEEALTGTQVDGLDRDVLSTAGERAAEDAAPVDDATGSADYKAQLVKVLVERTFRKTLA